MKNDINSTFASTLIFDSIFWKIIPDFWSMNPSISKSNLFDPSFFETAWINGAEFIERFVCHYSCLSLIVLSCKFKFFIKSFFSTSLHTLKMPLKPCCSKEILFIWLFIEPIRFRISRINLKSTLSSEKFHNFCQKM